VCACGERSERTTSAFKERLFFAQESLTRRSTRSIFISSAQRVSTSPTSDFATTLDVTHLDHGHDAKLPFALIPAVPRWLTFGENLTNTIGLCYKYVFTSYWRIHPLSTT